MNHLGRYFKKRLNELKMSEREMSGRCRISHSYLNQLIKGINPSTKKKISPTLATLEKLANGFGVSVEYLQKISKGIKVNESDNDQGIVYNNYEEYYTPDVIRQIKDFQDFMLELGVNKELKSDEEWSNLISMIKESIKSKIQELELKK